MRRPLLVPTFVALLLAVAAAPAPAASRTPPPRIGGAVDLAWPKTTKGADGRVPGRPLARWLARQVGPTPLRPRPPRRAGRPADVRRALAPTLASATGDPAGPDELPPVVRDGRAQRLQLVRSYDIPRDDPAYASLQNLSFTYDSAAAALGFLAAGYVPQAEMLLDQLAALQRTDGSFDLAYDTSTGASAQIFRTGTVAWVGLAAVTYRKVTGSDRYDKLIARAGDWVLAQKGTGTLLRGGPDVPWVSTQNNIVAGMFLAQARLPGEQYRSKGRAILSNVLLQLRRGDTFLQGVDDGTLPTDVQALGAVLLSGMRIPDAAARTVRAMLSGARTTGITIERSRALDAYNMTYAAKGPFTGLRPYADRDGPDLIWFEWTVLARIAMERVGVADPELTSSMRAWVDVTGRDGVGPLGASTTYVSERFNEFHVWPASAAGSWLLVQQTDSTVVLPTS